MADTAYTDITARPSDTRTSNSGAMPDGAGLFIGAALGIVLWGAILGFVFW